MLPRDLKLLVRYVHTICKRWNVNDFTLRTHTCGEVRLDHQGNLKLSIYEKFKLIITVSKLSNVFLKFGPSCMKGDYLEQYFDVY